MPASEWYSFQAAGPNTITTVATIKPIGRKAHPLCLGSIWESWYKKAIKTRK